MFAVRVLLDGMKELEFRPFSLIRTGGKPPQRGACGSRDAGRPTNVPAEPRIVVQLSRADTTYTSGRDRLRNGAGECVRIPSLDRRV